ncbi:MAG: cytochrome b [Betaproteobacteria bacterium]|nr:cytochrome b [Betaproteobacteria bacterium]
MKHTQSYGALLVSLHWLVAALIVLVFALGWWMGDMPKGPDKVQTMGWHQTVGISIFVLAIVRLAWRRLHGVPEMPLTTPIEKLAVLVQIALYLLMLAIPVFGYLTSSFGGHAVVVFGSLTIPGITAVDHDVHETMGDLHQALAYGLLGLVALHVAGALKHHLILRDDVLARMAPWVRKR